MLYKTFVRPALFALGNGDAEKAHDIVKRAMRITQQIPPILFTIDFLCQAYYNERPVRAFEITFPNRVGLAAGFDKNAEVLPFMQALGFGFLEIGSVLPDYQRGNDKPRMFRIEEMGSIINRMGFNSAGMSTVEANLRKMRRGIRVPVGISLGKMKNTPPEEAADDYQVVLQQLYDYGDYFVINVSSPNTEKLRELQTPAFLGKLVEAVVKTSRHYGGKPVLVKFDPDMPLSDLLQAVEAAMAAGASGIILTNTTTERPYLGSYPVNAPFYINEKGGMSGEWLFEKSLERVAHVHKHAPKVVIIAGGGINSVEREVKMLDAGATLIQIYTGLIYEGPDLVRKLRFLV
jgi:dihydroorotate dehydrogenase